MTIFKCDRCGRSCYDLYEIGLNEFYICDGRYQPYGSTYSGISLCQVCFDELKGFLNAYGKEVLHDDHCRDERPTKNDAKSLCETPWGRRTNRSKVRERRPKRSRTRFKTGQICRKK